MDCATRRRLSKDLWTRFCADFPSAIGQVCSRLHQHGITINAAKCTIGQPQVRFLGYLITKEGIKPQPEKVEAVNNLSKPKTITEMRKFLGMLNFYRRFLSNAAQRQAPLNAFIKGAKKRDNRPINWTPESEQAFTNCKEDLAAAALLAHPDEQAALAVTTDASETAIGATLEQHREGKWQPLGFFSKKLTEAQQKYSAYDRELLGFSAEVEQSIATTSKAARLYFPVHNGHNLRARRRQHRR